MQESQRLRIIKSYRSLDGEPLSRANEWDYELLKPKRVGERWGLAKVISPTVRVRETKSLCRGKYPNRLEYVFVECVRCKHTKWILYKNLRSGVAGGCRRCLQPARFPRWLFNRMMGAKLRCENPKDRAWKNYGGRGIKFKFPSVSDACEWVLSNLRISRDKEIDRIDNDGHYEPGNIRFSTRVQNTSHTRRPPRAPQMHRFRQLYPHITYADATLKVLFRTMTMKQVADRWKNRIMKPPFGRRSGTSSMLDPFIASRYKGC